MVSPRLLDPRMFTPVTHFGGTTTIHTECHKCKARKDLQVPTQRYWDWKDRINSVQVLFTKMDVDDRELLISSTCGACYDKAFLFTEDEDDRPVTLSRQT